ncbi:MAG: shikimate dehydrogenase [Myxococcales bacterium]|nr:shikimate dehydrogenase [Myxococcales bacterium]
MHEAGYRALGLDYRYVPFSLEERALGDALKGMRALGIRGFGISMPFKIAILSLLDDIDPLALTIGAVNTVVNDAGRLTGHNTDAAGAVRALEEIGSVEERRVLVIGAGGAARAVVYGLWKAGAQVLVVNRNQRRAEALVEEIRGAGLGGATAITLEDALASRPEFVVNATSVGMQGNPGEPIPAETLSRDCVVMDIVYKPLVTPWLERCRRRGNTVIHGGRMLLHQAARQFELYTGQQAPLAAMDEALQHFL